MNNKNIINAQGIVVESLPNASFKVELQDKSEVLCHLAGKLRMHKIKILPGDKVSIEMTPYDNTRGRIVYRNK